MKKNRNKVLKPILWIFLLGICFTLKEFKIQLNYGSENEALTEKKEIEGLYKQLANLDAQRYSPVAFVMAVNELQSLGKEGALEEINKYIKTKGKGKSNVGLCIVLRILFDLPPGISYPSLVVNKSDIVFSNKENFHRFPIAMVNDYPILLMPNFSSESSPQLVEQHLIFYRKHGGIIKNKLSSSQDPIEVERKLKSKWENVYETKIPQQIINFVSDQTSLVNS